VKKVTLTSGELACSHFPHTNNTQLAAAVAVGNVWSAARLQAKSSSWADGLLKCIRPVCGAKLLAMMESARRWSIKWVELRRVLIPTQA
jgi:hypothetical protein